MTVLFTIINQYSMKASNKLSHVHCTCSGHQLTMTWMNLNIFVKETKHRRHNFHCDIGYKQYLFVKIY